MRKKLLALATTGSTTILAQLLGILTNKIFAVVLGPAGVGLYGLFKQLCDMATGIAGIGSAGGRVQGLSSRQGEARARMFAAAVWLNLAGVLAVGGALFLAAPMIARDYIGSQDPEMVTAVRCLGVPVATYTFGHMLWNLVTVSQAFRLLALLTVIPAVASLVAAWPLANLATSGGPWGFMAILIVVPVAQIVFAVPIVRYLGWGKVARDAWAIRPTRADILHLFRFHGSNLVAFAGGILAFLVLPPLIVEHYGLDHNGFFRVAWLLCAQQLSAMLMSLAVYALPALSSSQDEATRTRTTDDIAVMVTILSIPLMGLVILFQPLVIKILLTDAFLPAIDTLRWMLIGNYFKTMQWLFVSSSMSRGHLAMFTTTELCFNFGLLGLGLFAVATPPAAAPIPWFIGIEGLGMLYCGLYVVTSLLSAVWSVRQYGYLPARRTILVWLLGAAVLAACSVATWGLRHVDWTNSLLFSLAVVGTPLLLLDHDRRTRLIAMVARLRGRPAAPPTDRDSLKS